MAKQEQSGAGSTREGGADSKPGAANAGPQGDGPGKIGLTSGEQPDLVAPSGVNQRDHGVADDKPMAGGTVNFDDDELTHPRGKTTAAGGTRDAKGGDSAPLGPPGAGLSNRNGPSDPGGRKP